MAANVTVPQSGNFPIRNILFGCFIAGQARIRNDMTPKARAKVLRHEYGHANGWEHE